MRRVWLALADGVPYGAAGGRPLAGAADAGRPSRRSLAAARDNGCLGAPAPAPRARPDRAAARIAGGDVAPARVAADPYPTRHGVAVDPVNGLVFLGDPNRHAIWSYGRLAASKGAGRRRHQSGEPRSLRARQRGQRAVRVRDAGAVSNASTMTAGIQ